MKTSRNRNKNENNSIGKTQIQSLRPFYKVLYDAEFECIDDDITTLAVQMVHRGQQAESDALKKILAEPFNNNIERDFNAPIFFEKSDLPPLSNVNGNNVPWNSGSTQSLTETLYTVNTRGWPRNPYIRTAIHGRGVIWNMGPNHAVDMAPLRIMPDANNVPTLHIRGIVRKDNGMKALCGGFTTFENPLEYTRNDVTLSQTREFIEELVSGSILPNEKSINAKMNYIHEHHADFFENVHDLFRAAVPCYAGPVLASRRNTDHAWMETSLSVFMLNEKTWDATRAGTDFDFSAGDDAADSGWYPLTAETLAEACPDHQGLLHYVMATYLANFRWHDAKTLPAIMQQAQAILDKPTP